MDVDGVDSAEQSFVANLYLDIRWQDPTLAHEGPGHVTYPLDAVWHPQLLLVNQQKIFSSLPEVVRALPDGEVIYRQRVWGSFSQPLHVRDFPFDVQDFEIRITAAEHTTKEITFRPHPELASGLADTISLPDWDIIGWELDFGESGAQIGIATTSMLTLIAYRFMVGGMIPPVPYLTRIDYFVLGSTVLVFAALIQAVLTSIMSNRQKGELARRLDAWCRIIFTLVFVLITWAPLIA